MCEFEDYETDTEVIDDLAIDEEIVAKFKKG